MKFRIYYFPIYFMCLVFSIIYLESCKTSSKNYDDNIQRVIPPNPLMDIVYEEYVFDADSAFSISLKSGTVIKIPKNAFVDSSGQKITEKVTFKVREFHHAEEIFKAGIPMNINSSSNEYLQSGGMIDLRAFKNNNNLLLDSGKYIDISLASFRETTGYQLYHFEKDNIWLVKDTFQNHKNDYKKRKLDSLELELEKERKEDYFMSIVADYEREPKLKKLGNIQWKIEASDVTDKFLEAMRINWDEIEVVSLKKANNKFKLNFKRKFRNCEGIEFTQNFEVKAVPVSEGKKLSKDKRKEIESIYNEYLEHKKFVALQADYLNTFRIQKLGIWNIDKVIELNNTITKNVSFDFVSKIDPLENQLILYLVFIDENSVIEYPAKNWGKVTFQKNSNIEVRVVLPGGKIVIIDKGQVASTLNNSDNKIVFKTE